MNASLKFRTDDLSLNNIDFDIALRSFSSTTILRSDSLICFYLVLGPETLPCLLLRGQLSCQKNKLAQNTLNIKLFQKRYTTSSDDRSQLQIRIFIQSRNCAMTLFLHAENLIGRYSLLVIMLKGVTTFLVIYISTTHCLL